MQRSSRSYCRKTCQKALPSKISDNGNGMTFEDCQSRYLNVGWYRRGDNPDEVSPGKSRPVLGRKGIGKFAGFGIAEILQIDTISKMTGERTIFKLNVKELRGKHYISVDESAIAADYFDPDDDRKKEHGTIITLQSLKLSRRPSPSQFAKSMARRFLLHQGQADFVIKVNGDPLPAGFDLAGVQFVFPRDYLPNEAPEADLSIGDEGWGLEKIGDRSIKWRFMFHRETIDEEELRGISVFAKGKLAQAPFSST